MSDYKATYRQVIWLHLYVHTLTQCLARLIGGEAKIGPILSKA